MWVRWQMIGVWILAGCLMAGDYPDPTPQSLEQARASLVLSEWVDQYRRIQNRFPGYFSSSDPELGSRIEQSMGSLTDYSARMEAALAGLNFCLDDQVDLILLRLHITKERDELLRRKEWNEEVVAAFPFIDLRERLPVLTGLVDDVDPQTMIVTLRKARSQIPAPWAVAPDGIGYSHAEAAGVRAQRLNRLLDEWLPRVKDRFPEEAEQVEAHLVPIQEGLKAFSSWIQDVVLPELDDAEDRYGTPVGEAEFVMRLRNDHMITETPDELIDFGKKNLAQLQARADEIAREIDSSVTPAELWQRLKQDHPSREELPRFVHEEMERSLKLLLDTGAVTVPANARENVVELSEDRIYETFPFGGYSGWSYKNGQYIGSFLTSPPKAWMTEAEQKARLLGNNVYWARVVAVHEMYPGHHLASVVADIHARPIRRLFNTNTFGEGWGLYSETMMYRLGFFPDKETELAMLKMQIWRAARVVIDVSLHLGRMRVEEAVTFLVDNVEMTRENALAEVRRYLGNPTRPLSYIYGFRKIEEIRAAVIAKQGDDFEDRAFHDRFLRTGNIPLPLVESLMLGTPLPPSKPVEFPDQLEASR